LYLAQNGAGIGISMAEISDQVFISYAREDIGAARKLYNGLSSKGLNVWFDETSLLAGQKWKNIINKEIRNSSFFLVLLSKNSIYKKGYVQKEIMDACEVAEELPPSSIFIIPILLEKCEIPYPRLSELQYVDMSTDWDGGLSKILLAIDAHQNHVKKNKGVHHECSTDDANSHIVDAARNERGAAMYNVRNILLAFKNILYPVKKTDNIYRYLINNHFSEPYKAISYMSDSTQFSITDAAKKLNSSNEFHMEQFLKSKNEESWIVKKPFLIISNEWVIHISITVRYDTNQIIFIMPIYGDGLEGLVGEKIEAFYNVIAHFNSRINGGFFTKYTYDESNAPIFMISFPLSRMDFDWFKETLKYIVNIYNVFKPQFDVAILSCGLKFQKDAAKNDPATDFFSRGLFDQFSNTGLR
jgi:hypothetical protein